ncbi:hypothetical protein FHR47_002289 [Xanthomonas arboricola]|uniref:DUF3310 domain-containing protein n=1 Tax=Xanthomonas cannabis TaxID=1885674 RepID=UPI001615460E|nr:DUF3310 domain-containing protein [Xanthomonas cannabis]MBB3802041.1 hypothetical protein [Xanthomonas cannabis]
MNFKLPEAIVPAGVLSALERQVGGQHYRQGGIQPVQFIESNGLGFCEGNIIKYVSRHRAKGGAEDLKKARHYIELLLELVYDEKV